MKRKLLRYSTFLILLFCSSFKSLKAANDREADRVSWTNKWKRELVTQIGYHSLYSIGINGTRYFVPKNEMYRDMLNVSCTFSYIFAHMLYISDKYAARQYKPYTQENYGISIGIMANIAAASVIDLLRNSKEKPAEAVESFALITLMLTGLHRLGKFAKKLYTKGYSRLAYEDIAPPADIIGALAVTWEASKFMECYKFSIEDISCNPIFPFFIAFLSVFEYEEAKRLIPNRR